MKKVFIVVMFLVLVASMSFSVFATPGTFVSSPSLNPAPELIEGKNETDDCPATIIITAYAKRDQLSAELRQQLEAAYAEIVGAKDVSELNAQLKAVSDKMGVNTSDLAVSDLFDISAIGCDVHGEHGAFDIILKASTLKNFVSLMHYKDGEWVIVDGAEVTKEGQHLEFTYDDFSPFAIVVSTTDIVPATGCRFCCWWILILILLIMLLLILWYIYKSSKKEKEQDAEAEQGNEEAQGEEQKQEQGDQQTN